MREFSKIFVSALAAFLPLCVSCEKGGPEVGAGARLELNVEVESMEMPEETKGQYYEGEDFEEDESFGLIILVHEDTPNDCEEFQEGYGNIRVAKQGKEWHFFDKDGNEIPNFAITSRPDRKTADIYAYAPYINEEINPKSLPINISDNLDIMYNVLDNKDIQIIDGGTIKLYIKFYHALSRLRIKVKLENPGSDQKLDYVKIQKKNTGTTPLYTAGAFDVTAGGVNPTFVDTTATDSIRINCGGKTLSSSQIDSVETILFPVAYVDSSYSVVFGIDGIPYEYVIKKEDLDHPTLGSGPLERSFKYTMNFTYYNYVHFNGLVLGQLSDGGSFNYTLQY